MGANNMSTNLLEPPLGEQTLLSDQAYRGYGHKRQTPRRHSVPAITMEASQLFAIPFGHVAHLEFENQPPSWLLPLILKVCELGNLAADWNSYGAKPVDVETAASSIMLLASVLTDRDPVPSVVPTSRGGVMLEWHIGGVDLEIDVRSPSLVHVAMNADGHEEEFENTDLELVQEKLNFLRGRL